MKFGKDLDHDLVPEWRSKYLDYSQAKKKNSAVLRALKDANRTPDLNSQSLPFTHYDFSQRGRAPKSTGVPPEAMLSGAGAGAGIGAGAQEQEQGDLETRRTTSMTMFANSPPVMIPGTRSESLSENESTSPERVPLRLATATSQRRYYGSFVGTPPEEPGPLGALELPDPAISPRSERRQPPLAAGNDTEPRILPPSATSASEPLSSSAYQVGPSQKRPSFAQRFLSPHRESAGLQQKPHTFHKSKLRKMFKPHQFQATPGEDVRLDAYQKLDAAQSDFFDFLDKELHKIGTFYKSKEDESSDRLLVLRQQLHELRDRRLNDVYQAQRQAGEIEGEHVPPGGDNLNAAHSILVKKENGALHGHQKNPLRQLQGYVKGGLTIGRVTKSLQQFTSPHGPQGQANDRGDYVTRQDHVPSYRVAKRRLKLALQEYYRGLELLKAYTLLNRTAFRKINKKYDKAVKARPSLRYYSEKVETAYFVKSEVIRGHLLAVEDLYARYFEKGNHKVAISKLRAKLKSPDQSDVAFRNGLYVAAGTCFGIAGLTTAVRRLFDPDLLIATNTSYLLQLYGGYFLALLLFLLFVLDCKIWTANRINYQFIFEYDARHTLDWRQLAELPCFFLFLNGIFLYLNFQQDNSTPFFRYWYLILVAITIIVMSVPFRILYYDARRWWGFSNWRLFFAGLYPVEFRDFYLGDMYCSITYTMSQIELFFCLYVNDWDSPQQCNSGHSRVLGFFATLPAIWRALQCLRRYRDSGNWFPHLANFAKYMGNILYNMSLSMYRINAPDWRYKTVFIVFAAINGVYCSVWDIFMDWSLGDWWSKNWFLRPRLAYGRPSVYYIAMVLDIILRQQWILYAVFTEDLQHQSAVSFFVALAEVLRRGMWSLFRVENEHCNNVQNYRASRDIPLPYKLPEDSSEEERPSQGEHGTPGDTSATGVDIEQQTTTDSSSTMRQRRQQAQTTPTIRALKRVGTAIASAHAQDFQKRARPAVDVEDQGGSSDDEDEEG